MKKIYYSEKLIDNVVKLSTELANSTVESSVNTKIRWYLSPQAHMARIKREVLAIEQVRRCTTKDSSILEIGSGIGTCCIIMKALTGAEIVGAEPAPESYSYLHECIQNFRECNPQYPYIAINAGGENIPYANETFDFIYSFEVLEHVQDPCTVLKEIYRLLKPNGCAYIATCNYDSFYEGHYERFWNPFIGVGGNRKRYIKKGLSPKFLSELNFITKKKIKLWTEDIGFSNLIFNPEVIKIKDKREFELCYPDGFIMPSIEKEKTNRLNRLVQSPFVTKILKRFDREYKLYFLLIK